MLKYKIMWFTTKFRGPAGPWGEETSQSKNVSIFGRVRLADMILLQMMFV